MDDDEFDMITPNGMSMAETQRLVENGTLNMVISQHGALVAVRSGVPGTGLAANATLVMFAAPVMGIIAAFFIGWWTAILGFVVTFFAAGVVKQQAMVAVRDAVFSREDLFKIMRRDGIVRFEFADE